VRGHSDGAEVLYAGELEVRPGEGLVLATGQALTLSVREFQLLAEMARRVGAIATREELYSAAWSGELRAGDRSVDVYVSKLRSKLEAAMPGRRFIHTHPGFGSRFQPQPAAGALDEGAGEQVNRIHEMFTRPRAVIKRLLEQHRTSGGFREPA
jgi:DNA-binding response OmpR family regulator